jgi:hypothetical protein
MALSLRHYLVVAALALAGGGAPALAAAPAAASGQSCFLSSDWQGWKSPSPSVIYLRIRINDVYRLDLSAPASDLDEPDVHLISKIQGSDWICNPLDLQLEVADDHGIMREPLFVKSITKLTPDEIKAIPAKFRP